MQSGGGLLWRIMRRWWMVLMFGSRSIMYLDGMTGVLVQFALHQFQKTWTPISIFIATCHAMTQLRFISLVVTRSSLVWPGWIASLSWPTWTALLHSADWRAFEAAEGGDRILSQWWHFWLLCKSQDWWLTLGNKGRVEPTWHWWNAESSCTVSVARSVSLRVSLMKWANGNYHAYMICSIEAGTEITAK